MRKKSFIVFIAFIIMLMTGCINESGREEILLDHAIRKNIPMQSTECTAYTSPWSKTVPRFAGDFPEANGDKHQYTIEHAFVDGQDRYMINAEAYYELTNTGLDSGLDGGDYKVNLQRWSVDCSFLEYAGASENYDVYHLKVDDGEVVVLRDQNESLLLAKEGSILLDTGRYNSSLFSNYCFDGKYYVSASDFPQITDAISSISANKAVLPENAWLVPMTLTMESNLYPGLYFSVHYYQYGDEDQFVFNSMINDLVKVNQPIRFEEKNEKILIAETSAYEVGKVFAKWSSRQPECNGRYVQNWRAADKSILVKKSDEDKYEIDGELYRTIRFGETDRMGWKVNLAFFEELGRVEGEKQFVLLNNIERDDLMILYSNDSLELLVGEGVNPEKVQTQQIDQFGLCWINNGIILPAIDAASLIPLLKDRQSQSDIPVRFESREYPGLSYCGWITEEEYGHIVNRP